MLDKKHIGCLFTITPHPYGSVTLQCGDEIFDMTYTNLHANISSLDITTHKEDNVIVHHFIALGDQTNWVYSYDVTGKIKIDHNASQKDDKKE